MHSLSHREAEVSSTTPFRQPHPAALAVSSLRHWMYSARGWRTKDRQHILEYIGFATLLVLITVWVVVTYYLNHPQVEPFNDTWSYLYVVERFQTHGQLVNFWRLPGYPLLIVLIYAFMGQGNLAALSVVHAVLFVLATLEFYMLTALVLRRAWTAFLVSLLVGPNVTLISYVKPILSEALALWLCVTLALAVVYFLHTLRARTLWLVTLFTLLLFMSRPEWIFLPIPLFAYLLLVAAWRGKARSLILHAVLSIALLYSILGGYVYINTTQNHFPGLTWIQNINELGKVLQYHMQDEAPTHYIDISRVLDSYVARGTLDPYPILDQQPSLIHNYATLSGKYAHSIIERHPGEFALKSLPTSLSSLTVFYTESSIDANGPQGKWLLQLQSAFRFLYRGNVLFPLCSLLWLVLLCWHRTRKMHTVQMMGAVVLLSLYALAITTVGAYSNIDYMRIHIPFDPLLTLVIWGSLLLGAILLLNSPGFALPRKIFYVKDETKEKRTETTTHAEI